ncbi:MAG: hypothetical protein IJI22_02910 [Bacilli bacterium]|nr:hypothetical protein [Bacilli bacterium]
MYTEEYERRGFPIRRFLIKLILTILFLLLLFWLLTRFVIPAFKGNTNKNSNKISNGLVINKQKSKGSDKNNNKTEKKNEKVIKSKSKDKTTKKNKTTSKKKNKKETTKTTSESAENEDALKAISSQIFSNNIDKMKEAAISYYTDERLPQEVGQSDKMTLSDMIGKKIIVPLIDKNNKACDVEKSYVKITKVDDEYILKVNIKDSEKEDYILVHLGCYTYCDSYICQKEQAATVTRSDEVTSTVPIKGSIHDGEYVPSKKPSKTTPSKPTPTETLKCRVKSGIYYGKNGNVVDKTEYKRQCIKQESKYYCKKHNGNYYGKNGEIVTLKEYKKQCITIDEKHYCEKYNGKYYGKDGSVVSETQYKKECTKPESKHYCEKYNGKYYGKDGSVVTETEYKKECIKVEYVYEYKKTTDSIYSNWTSWSDWSKTSCSTKEINCSDENPSCLRKLQLYKRKEKIGDHKKTYTRTREVIEQTGFYQQKSCSKYNYIEINKKIYATTSSYVKINDISGSTAATTGNWRYNGRASYSNPPRDTNTTHYKFVGADYSYCSETCETLPNYYYDSYTYVGGLSTVSSTTTIPSSSSSTGYASCGEYTIKTIPIYGTITVTEKATRDEPLYGDVCYQSTKNRSIIEEGTTKTTWSYYNNRELLDNGWEYTGAKKEK